MTLRCTPESMKSRIDCSSRHNVRVQKAKFQSRNSETARFPDAAATWRAARSEEMKKAGK
jgi:hypothetical protein